MNVKTMERLDPVRQDHSTSIISPNQEQSLLSDPDYRTTQLNYV